MEAFCNKMAPNTATHSTIASADAIAARRMSDLQSQDAAAPGTGGKGRSKGSRTISWMKHRTLWDGVSVALILRFYPERVEAKRGNGRSKACCVASLPTQLARADE